jgi:hypothetical protein
MQTVWHNPVMRYLHTLWQKNTKLRKQQQKLEMPEVNTKAR